MLFNRKKEEVIFLFLLLSWLANFLMIGNFISLPDIKKIFDIYYLFDIRGNIAILVFLSNLFLIFYFLFIKKRKINIYFSFFLIFLLGQIIGLSTQLLYGTGSAQPSFYITHTLNLTNSLMVLLNIYFFQKPKLFKAIIIFTGIVLSLFILNLFSQIDSVRPEMNFTIGENIDQRITINGLSRIIFLFYLAGLIFYLGLKEKILSVTKIVIFTALIFFSVFFYISESRFVFANYLFFSIVLILISSTNFKSKILIFSGLLIIPFIIYTQYSSNIQNISIKENRLYGFQGEKKQISKKSSSINRGESDIQSITRTKNEFTVIYEDGSKYSMDLSQDELKNLENRKVDQNTKIFLKEKKENGSKYSMDLSQDELKNLENRKVDQITKIFLKKKKETREKNKKKLIDVVSTGRLGKAKYLIGEIKKNNFLILGMGPQYDREIMWASGKSNFSGRKQGEDAANGLLNSIITGGMLSLVGYLLIIFFIMIQNIKFVYLHYFKNEKMMETNFFYFFSLCVCNFLVLRTLIENGFTSWGLDNLIFFSHAIFILFVKKNITTS